MTIFKLKSTSEVEKLEYVRKFNEEIDHLRTSILSITSTNEDEMGPSNLNVLADDLSDHQRLLQRQKVLIEEERHQIIRLRSNIDKLRSNIAANKAKIARSSTRRSRLLNKDVSMNEELARLNLLLEEHSIELTNKVERADEIEEIVTELGKRVEDVQTSVERAKALILRREKLVSPETNIIKFVFPREANRDQREQHRTLVKELMAILSAYNESTPEYSDVCKDILSALEGYKARIDSGDELSGCSIPLLFDDIRNINNMLGSSVNISMDLRAMLLAADPAHDDEVVIVPVVSQSEPDKSLDSYSIARASTHSVTRTADGAPSVGAGM